MNYLKLIRCYISGVVMDNITISNLLSIWIGYNKLDRKDKDNV